MAYVGGLRARLIRDSVYRTVEKGLRDLGWLTPQDTRRPINLVPEPVPVGVDVPLNTLAMGDEMDDPQAIEMGSLLTEFTWAMYFDFYGENDSISLHMIGDVAAILAGRMPSIGRDRPVVQVWDYTLATPVPLFEVEIEQVRKERAHDFPQPWLRFWRTCAFQVVDAYADESG